MTVYLERGYNHNEELKSLTRYRFDKVKERAKLKMSISWLSCILFPELKKLGLTLHMVSVYVLAYVTWILGFIIALAKMFLLSCGFQGTTISEVHFYNSF